MDPAGVRIILAAGDNKAFEPFEREGGLARFRGWSCIEVLDEFERLRRVSLAALSERNLTRAQLQLGGIHPEFGSVTLEQLIATWVTHDLAHLAQICRVLVRYFGQHVGPWSASFSLLRDR